ncbi:orotate phosphoribosyltransferase [Halochromatium glycolicum]|uniref:Orotate phosphoribosyltransferase n=1 Tax=Halochromatium glycolicum TaxID=85075 RepID=A0AAJ0U7F6_9GAMM|nr:orotate phosphoribosyltransferase [Halochromatium glycolicum]MBK1706210.1 orotate phosphoribosyltransferase [Halochromatium glycolicum]
MHSYQREFLRFAIDAEVLRFGRFTLKSGRISPYFFNAGGFDSGAKLGKLAHFYAQAIIAGGLQADVLFGPAYKGIPLAAATAIALAHELGRDTPFAFNRKEAKDHGEGGELVGSPLRGDVLLIDDVITAGTSIRESAALLERAGARLAGVIIALDRQERGDGERSAVQEVGNRYGIPVQSIVTLDDLIQYVAHHNATAPGTLEALQRYRDEYGCASQPPSH